MLTKSGKIKISIFIFILLISKLAYSSNYIEDKKAVVSGYKLVENFYSCLISDKMQETCNNIFDIAPYQHEKEIKPVWDYLRKNKKLFISDSNLRKDVDFFRWARKTVSYFNPRELDKITDGQLYITVVHTLPGRNNSGIYKEIAFPIGKDEKTGEYRIVFGNIKVNGILINYENDLIRDFDIIEALGFKPTPSVIKSGAEVENSSGLSTESGAMK